MKIERIRISNFRNFKDFDVTLGEQVVIVGENKIGKTNLLHALRLVLDPSLPDSARHLQMTDFWDGLGDKKGKDDAIEISIDLSGFEHNENLLAVLAEHIVKPVPMVARLTYLFRPMPSIRREPRTDADYEFLVYGGGREDNRAGYEVRHRIPLDVLQALRDAERDMASWMRSPLRPLLNEATKDIDQEELMAIADNIKTTTEAVLDLPTARADLEKANGNTEEWASPEIEDSLRRVDDHVDKPIRRLADDIASRLESMVGISQALQTVLGFSPTEPDRLLRSIRLLIDAGKRNVSDASLGSANLLYLTLKSLELDQLAKSGQRDHTFLAIEEPEAHLHPHLQRLVYRDFLRRRLHQETNTEQEPDSDRRQTVLLTTHSPHIVSVAPLRSIVLLKRSTDGEHTVGASATNVDLSCNEEHDIERYLDVNRGEILFARAVILVEGSAEEYLVPAFGKLLGHDFDELGISVCSVSGTNFTPYVRLLGRNGFQIPFAVLTDYDPRDDGKPLGVSRVLSLLGEMMEREEYDALSADDERLARAPELGVFLNQHTLEVDLFESGCCRSMCKTLIELADNDDAKRRALGWCRDSNSLDKPRFLKDIGVIGKGRFAQRLAGRIKADGCPAYIKEAVEYAAARCG